MKCSALILLAGLAAGSTAFAAEPVADEASATGSYAGVTVAIDPPTARLRAPTAAEQAKLRVAVPSRIRTADPMSIAKPGPKTVAEARRTLRRDSRGVMSMHVPEELMSHVTARQLEDGSIVISHGHDDAAPASTVEAVRE